MEHELQNTILNIILLSFEEPSDDNEKALRACNAVYDNLIAKANKEALDKSIAFIDFIDSLYTEEDKDIKNTLHVLRVEASKEVDYRIEEQPEGVTLK